MVYPFAVNARSSFWFPLVPLGVFGKNFGKKGFTGLNGGGLSWLCLSSLCLGGFLMVHFRNASTSCRNLHSCSHHRFSPSLLKFLLACSVSSLHSHSPPRVSPSFQVLEHLSIIFHKTATPCLGLLHKSKEVT